jgi:GNAT superfamily N-acetyltransferase
MPVREVASAFRAPATEAEWATYHAIRRRVLFELRGNGSAYDPHHPDERRPGHYPFLLWIAGQPVGVIRVDIDGATAIFRRVAIRDDLQRRGYGRRLLSEAEQFARSKGCVRIESHVDPPAVPFYERCGFMRVVSPSEPHRLPLMTKGIV